MSLQLEIIHDYIDQGAMHRITWIVIILIGRFSSQLRMLASAD